MKNKHKLKVRCMKCGKEWKKETEKDWSPDDFTSSLCNPCFREVVAPTIRRKQLKEGNFDCFGRTTDYCDQLECKYRTFCLRLSEKPERDSVSV